MLVSYKSWSAAYRNLLSLKVVPELFKEEVLSFLLSFVFVQPVLKGLPFKLFLSSLSPRSSFLTVVVLHSTKKKTFSARKNPSLYPLLTDLCL